MAKKILLLAIREYLREELTNFLDKRGYEVHHILTVAETYAWIKTHGKPYRLICDNHYLLIYDKTEPRHDGYTFLLELNQQEEYNDIKFGIIGMYDDANRDFCPELPDQLCFWFHWIIHEEELEEAIEKCNIFYHGKPRPDANVNPTARYYGNYDQDKTP